MSKVYDEKIRCEHHWSWSLLQVNLIALHISFNQNSHIKVISLCFVLRTLCYCHYSKLDFTENKFHRFRIDFMTRRLVFYKHIHIINCLHIFSNRIIPKKICFNFISFIFESSDFLSMGQSTNKLMDQQKVTQPVVFFTNGRISCYYYCCPLCIGA